MKRFMVLACFLGVVAAFCPSWTQETRPRQNRPEKPAAVAADRMGLYEARMFKGVMPYRLMKPVDFDPEKAYPLVLSLHGKGGLGNDNLKNLRPWNNVQADEALRKRFPCFVLVPQTDAGWTNPKEELPEFTEEYIATLPEAWHYFAARRLADPRRAATQARSGDLLLVFELLDAIRSEFKIDENRIYVIGHSMGGFGSWNALYERPDLFAAAIPTAGGLVPWKDPCKFADVPVWTFHSDDDPVVSVGLTRDLFEKMKACGGDLKYTELHGVKHGSANVAFVYTGDDPAAGNKTQYASDRCDKEDHIWKWLFSQTKEDRE